MLLKQNSLSLSEIQYFKKINLKVIGKNIKKQKPNYNFMKNKIDKKMKNMNNYKCTMNMNLGKILYILQLCIWFQIKKKY